jgi:hypothetical protein
VFFQRSLPGNYQTVLGNGYSTLASWGIVMPPGTGTDDDIGLYLAQEVGSHLCVLGLRLFTQGCVCLCGHVPVHTCVHASVLCSSRAVPMYALNPIVPCVCMCMRTTRSSPVYVGVCAQPDRPLCMYVYAHNPIVPCVCVCMCVWAWSGWGW